MTLRGSWVFDVAPALVAPESSDPMTLLIWVGDGRLDSRLAIRIPLAGFAFQQGRRSHTGETGDERVMRAWLSKLWVRNVIGAVVVAGGRRSGHHHRSRRIVGDIPPHRRSGRRRARRAERRGRGVHLEGRRDKYLNRSPNSYGPPLPAGTVLSVITVERTGPPPEKVVCNGVITDGERRWKNEASADSAADSRRGHQPVQPARAASIHIPAAAGCGADGDGHRRSSTVAITVRLQL